MGLQFKKMLSDLLLFIHTVPVWTALCVVYNVNHYLIRLSPNFPEAKVLLWKKINKKAAIIQQSAIKSAACKLLLKIRI